MLEALDDRLPCVAGMLRDAHQTTNVANYMPSRCACSFGRVVDFCWRILSRAWEIRANPLRARGQHLVFLGGGQGM